MKNANRKIVEFIRDKWVIPSNNNSLFAKEHFIDEKTVRRIKEDNTYQIALITIMRICEARNLKLADFFKMVDV
jgi:DNA-binding Xre family transcriptional regulator